MAERGCRIKKISAVYTLSGYGEYMPKEGFVNAAAPFAYLLVQAIPFRAELYRSLMYLLSVLPQFRCKEFL
jgi:hypothetical protein